MPTYAYRCPACGNEFDVFQKITDPPGAPCPRCGAQAERVITGGGGLLFKGGGFYLTDYRSEGYKKAAKSESGGEGGGSKEGTPAKDAGGGATKPADSGKGAGDAKPASKDAPRGGGA